VAKLDHYQTQAYTTAAYPESAKVAYPALGLVSEVGELLDTEFGDRDALVKELGDVVWYCAAIATDLDFKLSEAYGFAKCEFISDVQGIWKNAHLIAGRVKKIIRGDSGRTGKILAIRGYVGDVIRRVEALAAEAESSLEEVCEGNLDKLFDRKDRGQIKGDGDNR
jgi:NTP pyrophosphatase (non-canonical NTP hydrolase)